MAQLTQPQVGQLCQVHGSVEPYAALSQSYVHMLAQAGLHLKAVVQYILSLLNQCAYIVHSKNKGLRYIT